MLSQCRLMLWGRNGLSVTDAGGNTPARVTRSTGATRLLRVITYIRRAAPVLFIPTVYPKHSAYILNTALHKFNLRSRRATIRHGPGCARETDVVGPNPPRKDASGRRKRRRHIQKKASQRTRFRPREASAVFATAADARRLACLLLLALRP